MAVVQHTLGRRPRTRPGILIALAAFLGQTSQKFGRLRLEPKSGLSAELLRRSVDIRRVLTGHPYFSLIAGILLLVGFVWVMEGGRSDELSAQSSSVSLTGVVGGPTPRVGEPAPDFTLEAPDATRVSLSGLRGRPVFVNFWASWCPPCRGEMPDIQQIADEYREAGLVVVGVNLEEEREPALRYAQTLGLTFTLLLDRNGAVATRYNVTGLPTSYFVGRDGRIRDRNVGPLTPKGLRSKVTGILQ
jgi:cytochrome c biogenesis protein CcmG, thiol:disulfide interchange protein DsbE